MTEGGLRWIRYRFINEHQAGMAVAISYHVVSICKAQRTKWKEESRDGMTLSEEEEIQLRD